ncbi:uncharacterized protein TRIADDRAFT_63823 [Trichoplax adhaerens]|uniref:Synembryn-A n=1 Tax=Trichoplax adhaerens TaxID=10228 RepID=B3RUD0_TRIAD|nr:hypothetical protein TRIADDRAFT_63823 [Trichoplax adhaerens]EDV25314.1 hypothetical protein TRIADDRAFT_63823 [Trichoplax adhaerens]|eukprot:XP_002111347.1 hypothetical protein TRIADDRAFT_63823 [Trichoplax adhaerens]
MESTTDVIQPISTKQKIEKCIQVLKDKNFGDCQALLEDICDKLDKQFTFDQVTGKLYQDLVITLCKELKASNDHNEISLTLRRLMLSTLRIFSRDRSVAMKFSDETVISMLIQQIGYHTVAEDNVNTPLDSNNELDNSGATTSEEPNHAGISDDQIQVIIEAQKCLCNLIYQNASARAAFQARNGLEGICNHVHQHDKFPYAVKLYDLRLLFLLSALPPLQRSTLLEKYQGLKLIINQILRYISEDAGVKNDNPVDHDQQQDVANAYTRSKIPLSDDCMSLVSESLRILFNITLELQNQTCNEEDLKQIAKLVETVRKYIIHILTDLPVVSVLQKDIVNIFVNIPPKLLSELLILPLNGDEDNNEYEIKETVAFCNRNMIVVQGLLDFLHSRLPNVELLSQQSRDSLKPILTLLCSLSRADSYIRKYLKLKVLPPRKDFTKRPEEGNSLESRLIALLTSPWDIKNLVEDFLFVLCKENADRFIKHTGYGNAAGMLLSRGLLAGNQTVETVNYSSDDTDSDTEEYKEQHDKIDPVTGAIKADNQNIFEGMTEEEIEKEAEHLFTLFKKLNDHGIIRPVDRSGQPINLPDPSIFKKTENEDSDQSDS